MNAAARELRRPWCYLVAVLVGAGAMTVGLPWFLGIAIAAVAFGAGIAVAGWVVGRFETDTGPPRTRSRSPDGPAPSPDEVEDPVFRLEGEFWTIHFHAGTFRLQDAKGLRYLHRLLSSPGQEVHVLELVAGGGSALPAHPSPEEARSTTSPSEPMLDPQAIADLKRREDELLEQIREAEDHGDFERASLARSEHDMIADYLHHQLRPDGTSRTIADAAERARVNVHRAIRASITKIEAQDRALGHHLDHDIRTGTFCAYVPDPTATPRWSL